MTENSSTPLSYIDLDFKCKSEPIDYFHINRSVLSMDEFHVEEIDLNLQPNEYLTMEHLNSIDHNTNETIVFNIPVNRGKTSRCYDLIRKYHADGYYVIVCSPFQKLVEKDYAELSRYFEAHEIFSYTFIEKNTSQYRSSLTWGVDARIQIMTINCLLQNPGEDQYEQAFVKRDFLNYLFDIIRSKKEKIVLFFDEIHEAVHNFKNEFIPSLIKWQSLTHKCYISSATHTAASIPIIRYISLLTLCHIKIFFTSRVKSSVQADLHLHISTEKYSGKTLSPLNKIIQLITRYKNEGRKINILSGHKTIVEALINERNKRPLVAKVRHLEPNICTSDTKNEFNQRTHNIGTNFKTGVNIESNRSALIIILPVILNEKAHYGIFQDGVPSIIQSLGRLRNGGCIHIFMYAPDTIIDLESHKGYLDERLYNGKSTVPYIKQTAGYANFRERYDRKVKGIAYELELLQGIGLEEVSPELKYHYPTFQEELINKSQDILLRGQESFGRGLSSYVLWAAINNQFCNTELKKIELITKAYQTIDLTSENLFAELLVLLSDEQRQILRSENFKVACSSVLRFIQSSTVTKIDKENETTEQLTVSNKFTYDNTKKKLTDLTRNTAFNQAIVNMVYFLKTGNIKTISKEQYIHTCIANALANPNEEVPGLIEAYRRLHHVKQEFSQFILSRTVSNKAQERIIQIDSFTEMSEIFAAECILTIRQIKSNDSFFRNTYSLLQGIEDINVVDSDIKRRIWLEFKKLFTNIGEERKSHNGEKNRYNPIPENVFSDHRIEGIEFI